MRSLFILIFGVFGVFLSVVSTSASDCLESVVSEVTYYVSSGTENSTHSRVTLWSVKIKNESQSTASVQHAAKSVRFQCCLEGRVKAVTAEDVTVGDKRTIASFCWSVNPADAAPSARPKSVDWLVGTFRSFARPSSLPAAIRRVIHSAISGPTSRDCPPYGAQMS